MATQTRWIKNNPNDYELVEAGPNGSYICSVYRVGERSWKVADYPDVLFGGKRFRSLKAAQAAAQEYANSASVWDTEDEDEAEDACPGCGKEPGEGVTESCNHPNGCGFWKEEMKRV